MTSAEAEQWLTIPEVAGRLRLSVRTVDRLITDGLIEVNAPGRRKRRKLRVSELALAKHQASAVLKVPGR